MRLDTYWKYMINQMVKRLEKLFTHSFSVVLVLCLSIIIVEISGKVYALTVDHPDTQTDKATMLGQKLMLDLRYFCRDDTQSKQCRQPVTELPTELSHVLSRHAIGGVILFAENLATTKQIKTLTAQIRATAIEPDLPLFIAIDQEGGRVARLPTDYSPAFSGNMALGATYAEHQTQLASQVAKVIGQDLLAMGINVNFAPTVDVNANPQNPVINVRSFGESVPLVSAFGTAFTQSLQAQGVLAAIKHFPGHGDTHVDSHTGLPQVNHDKATIMAQDIAPFAHIIATAQPAFVMTAHIQFPALDDSTLFTTKGEQQIRPATLSRPILTGLLREQLKFDGLIVTDALDMAGIAQYFSPLDAVLETFNAGADIALMPFTIRNHQDIRAFDQFMQVLTSTVTIAQIESSFARIKRIKQHLRATDLPSNTDENWPPVRKHQLAANLAKASVTQVFGTSKALLSKEQLSSDSPQNILLVMPDELRCAGLNQAIKAQHISIKPTSVKPPYVERQTSDMQCLSTTTLAQDDPRITAQALQQYDVVIAGDISPQVSLVEMGGMDDLSALRAIGKRRNSLAVQQQLLKDILGNVRPEAHTVFVALRTPYIINQFSELSDAAFAIYDYRVDETTFHSDSFNALALYLFNDLKAPGVLPVTIPQSPLDADNTELLGVSSR
jgi:beta-N-acetylhexosaminidase